MVGLRGRAAHEQQQVAGAHPRVQHALVTRGIARVIRRQRDTRVMRTRHDNLNKAAPGSLINSGWWRSGGSAYESALGVGHIVQLPGDVDLPRVQPAVVVRICTGWDETNATRVVSRRRLTHSPTN